MISSCTTNTCSFHQLFSGNPYNVAGAAFLPAEKYAQVKADVPGSNPSIDIKLPVQGWRF